MRKIAGPIASALAIVATAAVAHKGATGVTLERMQGMMALRDMVRDIAPIMQGAEPYDALRVSEAGYVISRHAGQTMLGLFTKGSTGGVTFAKLDIWQDWTEFAALANDLHRYAKALSAEAAMGLQPPQETVALAAASEQPIDSTAEERRSKEIARLLGYLDQRAPTRTKELSPRFRPVAEEREKPQGARELFVKIGATCSACHARFRRGKG